MTKAEWLALFRHSDLGLPSSLVLSYQMSEHRRVPEVSQHRRVKQGNASGRQRKEPVGRLELAPGGMPSYRN